MPGQTHAQVATFGIPVDISSFGLADEKSVDHLAVSIHKNPAIGETTLATQNSGDVHEAPVSVVGSFNDWTPGVHVRPPKDGTTRSATSS